MEEGPVKQFIGFRLGESEYTIPILRVREIINTPPITGLPKTPPFVKGIINLRGRIVPVIDLRELVELEGVGGAAAKVIVITGTGATYGILVDGITSVVNIEETQIESPEGILGGMVERVEGVARLGDRLVILLDTDKLVAREDLEAFGPELFERPGREEPSLTGADASPKAITGGREREAPSSRVAVEGARPSGPSAAAEHLQSAKDRYAARDGGDKQKVWFINTLMDLLETLSARDFDSADVLISEMMTSSKGDLYRMVGQVTRKLHENIKEFKAALDPGIKKIANEEVPHAVDRLGFVLERTADAANITMEIVEKYQSELQEFATQVERIRSPKAAARYLDGFGTALARDLNGILVAQEFQDITGQAIGRVIDLIHSIETELVGLITTFGVKADLTPVERAEGEKISQDEIEDLLREFGF